MRPQGENYEYEAGKPDDLTPRRIAELAVSAVLLAKVAADNPPLSLDEIEAKRKRNEINRLAKLKCAVRKASAAGLSHKEISKKLKVPAGTVHRWLKAGYCGRGRPVAIPNTSPTPRPSLAASRSP